MFDNYQLSVLLIFPERHNVTYQCQKLWMSSTGITKRGSGSFSRAFGPSCLSVDILGVVAPAKLPKVIHPRTGPSQPVSHSFT